MAKKQITYFDSRTFAEVILEGSNSKTKQKIFGSFLYEDTNTYFFSRTNLGKSILCMQIALAAATGESFDPCLALRNESEPKRVLLADMENDPATVYSRHAVATANFDARLLDNLIIIHENPIVKPVFSYELLAKIEEAAVIHKAQLIILDNISRILPDLLKAEDVARVIEFMKRIRQNTGASFLVVGHSTKTDNRTALTAQGYYGSSALQNFFPEIWLLDAGKNENFFLCHAKTKHEECYSETVPVLSRGEHPDVGVGFSYLGLQNIAEIQLPHAIGGNKRSRRTNLFKFKNEVNILDEAGVKRSTIADMCDVARSTVYRLLDKKA